ncbi:MAG TPA: NAD(P)/FAD-dependent oxidoreductase [Candidatus Limnocylindrales bacterium]|nr:NAD(P)/FAD-dependent oxidoreductase [Candidatus Limnocylindrales bacterium]
MTPGRDLLVAGGGPVGLYAAIEAAQAGLDVAVLEARPGVLDKACGEGLMPAAVCALERAGVRIERKYPFLGIRYVEGASRAEGKFSDGPGWGVRRTELHRALTERMRQLAIPVIAHRVQQIEQNDDSVSVDGMRTRYVLACDGLRSGIRRRLELEDPPRHRTKRYGLRQHFRVQPWSEFVEVHWQELGEAYVTPVADDEVGVAMLFDERSLAIGAPAMDDLLVRLPELAGRLAGASPCSTVRGAGPFEQRAKRVVDGRVLLAGDAAGYLDPITGEGLRLGFVAAVAAVDAITHGQVPAYEASWRRLVRRYWWSTTALLALRRSPLRHLMMPALCRVPSLFDSILDSLGAKDEPVAGKAGRTVQTPA